MTRAFLIVIAAYALAGAAAVGTGILLQAQQPIVIVGLADVAATIVIFLFSVITNNSSIYDPYWSVAPVPIALFWLLQPGSNGFANVRHVLIFALLCLWALRLTANWAMRWRGLSHEDWRYRDMRKQIGRLYWPISLLGIHLMPTVLIEGTADVQMRRFRRTRSAEQTIPPGLWSASRHPNYFGEVLIWWGLFLFVPLAHPDFWWAIAGPITILLLFLGISIPIMERHLLAEHPTYAEYKRRVSPFVPWVSR